MTSLVELRILEGPNLYFPRAAVKLTLDVSTITEAGDETVLDGEAAVLMGFATAVSDEPAKVAARFDYRVYSHAPQPLREQSETLGTTQGKAAILAMIPLSRNDFFGPQAIAIMGGLTIATALTIFFVPALYAAWFKVERTPQAKSQETARPLYPIHNGTPEEQSVGCSRRCRMKAWSSWYALMVLFLALMTSLPEKKRKRLSTRVSEHCMADQG